MRVNDPTFLDLSGAPAAPGAAPSLVVMEGELTDLLLAEVQQLYKQFCDQKRTSLTPQLMSERRLSGGGLVRMQSLFGQDLVRVWVSSTAPEVFLRHGIVVVTPWSSPCFYGRVGEGWKAVPLPVPQAPLSTYDLTVKERSGVKFHLPTTLNQERVVWDWARHPGPEWSATQPVVPVVLDVPAGTDLKDWHAPHFAVKGEVKTADGAVLFSSAESDPIITDMPEGAKWAPPSTDLLGKFLLLQHSRANILSTTANVWKHRFCTEKIKRLGENEYVSERRRVVDVITPFSELTVNTSQIIDNNLDAEPDLNALQLTSLDIDYAGGGSWAGSGWFDPPGVNEYFVTGLKLYDFDESIRSIAFRNMQAVREVTRQAPGPTQIFDDVALLGGATPHSVKIKSNLSFPRKIDWRAGYDNKLSNWSSDNYPGDKWGCVKVENVRRDLGYEISGEPNVEIDLGFAPAFRAFEGTLSGVMKGKEHYTERNLVGVFSRFRDYTIMTLTNWPNAPGSVPNGWYQLQAENWKSEYVALNERYAGGEWYSNTIVRDDVEEVEPDNTGEYSYTSRYIIDCDPKTEFYVAIKVEVHCTGAHWEHRPDLAWRGNLEKAADPSYTVIISVVASWRGEPEETEELVRSTATRPPFEFGRVWMVNPYYWPLPIAMGREIAVNLPPAIVPDERMLTQLDNITKHQGVNPRVAGDCSHAGAAVLPDDSALWIDRVPTTTSKIEAGKERPNAQMPLGQVYARTIRLADFSDALWLLGRTRCDAEFEGFQPLEGEPRPRWHYMPDLGTTIANQDFHIEVRDGKFVDWSDDIPAKEGATRPPKNGRNIEVYIV